MRRMVLPSLAVLVLGLASLAEATTVRALSNQALTSNADVIAIGRVVSREVRWEGRVLLTDVTVEVVETLKGAPGERIVVTVPGGVDMNRRIPIGMTYPGAPTMQDGERVFLFLDQDDQDSARYGIVGFSQGKFSINVEPSGVELVDRDLTQIRLASGAGIVRGSRERVTLVDFKREINRYLAAQ